MLTFRKVVARHLSAWRPYLGHVIDAEGCRPLPGKVKTATNFPSPTSKRQLRRFLGMVNFYRRFIPGCATLPVPLNSLTAGKTHGPINLSADESRAFQKLKDVLAKAALLALPIPNALLSIMVDASTTAAGAVLHQQRGTERQPLAFFSKTFSPRSSVAALSVENS